MRPRRQHQRATGSLSASAPRRRHWQASCQWHKGFTLLELLVVGTIGVLLLSIIASAWRWYGKSISQQQISVTLSNELKLAAEAISQDYGPALASRTLDGTTLQIDLDGPSGDGLPDWTSPDTVLEYVVQDGKLLRKDLTNVSQWVIAGRMKSLSAAVVDGKLQVQLTAEVRKTEQSLTLSLSGT